MKVLVAVVSLGLVLGLAACTKPAPGDADHKQAASADSTAKEYYTCPMHPSVISDKPGACPICGMTLVKRTVQSSGQAGDIESLKAVSLSPAQRVLANVSTWASRRSKFAQKIAAVGVIDYAEPNQAKVSARFRGRIEKLYVNFTGEVVKKGQPLFDLYSPELVSAEREYILALNALAPLRDPGADQVQKVQQEALVNASRERLRVHYGVTDSQIAKIASTKEASSTATYFSPIHGTVVAKEVQEGQYVDEGTLLYQLADLTKVWAYLDVYEKDVRFIKRGQSVTITTDAYPGERFNGRVAFIDPVLDPQSRTARVRVELNNASGKLKPQMYVTAETQVAVANSIIIPSSALLSTGKRDVVWVEVKPNVFEPRDVIVGMRDGTDVQILQGLNEGDMVAISGGFMLDSESQLQQPAGGGSDASKPMPPMPMRGESPRQQSDVRAVRIVVNGEFVPNVIHVKKGETTRLQFYREKESGCVEEVLIPGLDIRQSLPVLKTTTIEITPKQKGELVFTCGMEMVKGTLVVDEN